MSELRRSREESSLSCTPSNLASASASPHAPEPAERLPTITSTALLGSGGILCIEHNAEIYTLRRTRNGRLILTK
jgi:hemin uptake protein HemP